MSVETVACCAEVGTINPNGPVDEDSELRNMGFSKSAGGFMGSRFFKLTPKPAPRVLPGGRRHRWR